MKTNRKKTTKNRRAHAALSAGFWRVLFQNCPEKAAGKDTGSGGEGIKWRTVDVFRVGEFTLRASATPGVVRIVNGAGEGGDFSAAKLAKFFAKEF